MYHRQKCPSIPVSVAVQTDTFKFVYAFKSKRNCIAVTVAVVAAVRNDNSVVSVSFSVVSDSCWASVVGALSDDRTGL
jgi:hypothetical protein